MLRAIASGIIVLGVVAGSIATAPPAESLPPTAGVSTHVLINELTNGDSGSDLNSFAELRNWGDAPVDLSGWHLYRCSVQGLRSNIGRPEGDLTGVVLAPGAVVTISRVGMPGQLHVTSPYNASGFGLYLEAPDGQLVDRVGVYPNEPWPTQSECTPSTGNLPNALDFSRDESWQRVDDTGDVTRDFIVGPSTPGLANARRAAPVTSTGVVISEVTGAGPDGGDDEFVELRNDGDQSVDIGGWTLDQCTPAGRLWAAARDVVLPAGTTLDPQETWVIAGLGFSGDPDGRYETWFGDVELGVMLRDSDDGLVDRVAVSAYRDSACQGDGTKLEAILDAVAGESWQRLGSEWIVAGRTPGSSPPAIESSVLRSELDYPDRLSVAISEIATDPGAEGMPAGSVRRNWIELGNYGDTAVDIGGWTLRRCQQDGTRALHVQVAIPEGTVLGPSDTYLAARAGTAAAESADATYDTALNFLGSGVWVADAEGRRVDSVGIYAVNEMDASNVTLSPCTKGVALTTYRPDRLSGQTFLRTRFTGVDADDFVVGAATPGELDLIPWVDPLARVGDVRGPGTSPVSPSAGSAAVHDGAVVTVREAWGGVSAEPLTTLAGDHEVALDAARPGPVADAAYGFPYQRLVIDAGNLKPGATLSWSGTTLPRHEIQLSVWNGEAWRALGAGSTESGTVRIDGEITSGDIVGGILTLLVQDGPRTVTTISADRDGELENPANYDLALSHITDTQYLTETYPEVYAQLVSWIADNADDRKIEFATHTGDLVQNWVDPDQNEDRARREFAAASAIQTILEDAGVRTSVLPGNHDNKRGVDGAMFNDYFAPARYTDQPWYGGSIAPDDNSANFSTFESAGARFLMLSLPYAYGDRELTWAEGVIAAHPEYNVVISTHEHVTPKTAATEALRSNISRWVSHGDWLWERLIVPNRNVVLVLSGHFHGLGQITTENVGGVEGRTVVELLADYQEFRTHTGERATGFQRLLQLDLASGTVAVDTFSVRLDAAASYPYDYRQFLPDNGLTTTPANGRPWRIVEAGLQDRYSAADDEFTVRVAFQYDKSVATMGLTFAR